MRCVRPIFTWRSHARAFAASDFASASSAGTRRSWIATAPATCMAVGKVSLELWPQLTSSFGCSGIFEPMGLPCETLATFAITSLTFMLVLVPEPVWKTSIGKWRITSPRRSAKSSSRRSHASTTAVAFARGSVPSRAFASAHARFSSR